MYCIFDSGKMCICFYKFITENIKSLEILADKSENILNIQNLT